MGEKVVDVERFFGNCEFWMRKFSRDEFDLRAGIARLSRRMEVFLSDPASDEELLRLIALSNELFSVLFQAVSSCKTLGRMIFQPVYCSADNEDDVDEIQQSVARFYLNCSYICDRNSYGILLIGHSHSANALLNEHDRKQAEEYMEIKMADYWFDCSADSVLYGAILIGGRIAFYQMDENGIFSRLINGIPESADSMPPANLWKPICESAGDAGLSQLLAIVMKYRFKVDEEKVCKVVKEREELFIKTYGKSPVAPISPTDSGKDKEAVDETAPLTEEHIAGVKELADEADSRLRSSSKESSPERKSNPEMN